MKHGFLGQLNCTLRLLLPVLTGAVACMSCSENDNYEDEYANWQERNDAFFATLEDSLLSDPAVWVKFKSYSKNQSLELGSNTDCIYVKKILEGDAESGSPAGNDSVRVSYRGRLMPSANYPLGYTFDTRAYGTYDQHTNATAKFLVSGVVDGFETALLHMHKGDYWRVYVPYTLGYGSAEQSSIPAYSTLIFDLTLVDFTPAGESMPNWSARHE